MKYPVSFLLFIIPAFLWANGGPVDGSGIVGAGNMQFINMPQVKLQKEKLSIEIQGAYCSIHTRYTLVNESKETQEVKYGFPIDFTFDETNNRFAWDDAYIKDLRFTLAGKELTYEGTEEFTTFEKYRQMSDNDSENAINLKRKWFYTHLDIPTEQSVDLEVSYLLQTNFTDVETSKDFFRYFSPRTVYWDFTPAMYWGME